MESLLACYASDEEGEEEIRAPVTSKSSIPPLPEPRISNGDQGRGGKSMFSFLPAPKRNKGLDYHPPIDTSALDEEEDAGNAKKKPRLDEKEMTVVGGLVLPAPRNSLGIGGALGGGRGQALDFSSHGSSSLPERNLDQEEMVPSSSENVEESGSQEGLYYEDPFPGYQTQGYDGLSQEESYQGQENGYEGLESGAFYEDQGQDHPYQYYEGDAVYDQAQAQAPVEEDPVAKAMRQENRKGRVEPVKFVQIKQDDLTANRPREDQLRMTGIAFGSTFSSVLDKKDDEENKPSKLHKKKHQIGSLYYDMKQKEFELMERRARGFLSKAQTHAKYGW
ncbi:hypothetical protein SELMODRAFT_270529 [Selaginella moellendorffii]|uniref:Proline-rich protein PRCC n=1 Tax=Selaginella moellendorffii TaxID=88036 RepID=D8R416_SELML|nr:uncharacterized protein LOC9636031 [Selaginella moellendorffii]EFJ33033.1 hypothetical protein SELMODRAFT_270529 [Selaginella moellendorffii]|eukprot:XP_002965613.1 uncharacterized protein LOC9636031 [Selaginella moellendorffii]